MVNEIFECEHCGRQDKNKLRAMHHEEICETHKYRGRGKPLMTKEFMNRFVG